MIDETQKLGFTYSYPYAEYLGLNWQDTLRSILRDHIWESIRIPVYWDRVESQRGTLSLDEIVWQIEEAERSGTKVVPVIGYRNPRWPERHGPDWVKHYSEQEFSLELFRYVQEVVKKLQVYPIIEAWQVENEPWEDAWGDSGFGVIPDRYHQEIDLIRHIDSRPILVTYGYKPWQRTFPQVLSEDIVGLDVYTRIAIQKYGRRIPLSMRYFPWAQWRWDRELKFLLNHHKRIWITELQAEPWDAKSPKEMTKEEVKRTFQSTYFRQTLEWVCDPRIERVYIWGMEWWYTLSPDERDQLYTILGQER